MKKIIILLNNGFFTQHLHEYQNIDLFSVEKLLQEKGFLVEYLEYNQLGCFDYEIDDDAIYWSGSHQNVSVKHYINDVLFSRFNGKTNIVPALDTILAHENKGIMGILASEKKLPYIKQNYCLANKNNLDSGSKYPFVYKLLGGAGSKGVKLIRNRQEQLTAISRTKLLELSTKEVKEGAKNIIRNLIRRKEQAKYLSQQARYCEQDFIPSLDSDYKVLVFWDKVFVLKRSVRKGDFRASGSGHFEELDAIDQNLAELAIDCRKKLNSPYCSLDFVLLGSSEYKLIEFQTCHFGPYTQLFSKFYYQISNGKIVKEPNSFEEEITLSLIKKLDEASI